MYKQIVMVATNVAVVAISYLHHFNQRAQLRTYQYNFVRVSSTTDVKIGYSIQYAFCLFIHPCWILVEVRLDIGLHD
jgi:hypothetical protein